MGWKLGPGTGLNTSWLGFLNMFAGASGLLDQTRAVKHLRQKRDDTVRLLLLFVVVSLRL